MSNVWVRTWSINGAPERVGDEVAVPSGDLRRVVNSPNSEPYMLPQRLTAVFPFKQLVVTAGDVVVAGLQLAGRSLPGILRKFSAVLVVSPT